MHVQTMTHACALYTCKLVPEIYMLITPIAIGFTTLNIDVPSTTAVAITLLSPLYGVTMCD